MRTILDVPTGPEGLGVEREKPKNGTFHPRKVKGSQSGTSSREKHRGRKRGSTCRKRGGKPPRGPLLGGMVLRKLRSRGSQMPRSIEEVRGRGGKK